jgi:Zn-dependent protease/CBS domain-containing protein
MRSGIRLGSIAGIAIVLDWSLLIIFLLIVFSLGAGVFPTWHPHWSPGVIWVTAVAAAVLFFASVLAHELSHALVGRACGVDIRRITLFIFGGMAQLEREPGTWRAELWMAIVGPATSLLLGCLFIVLGSHLVGPVDVDAEEPRRTFAHLGPVATLLFWLGPVNILLGLFNLVPGFPLDGGRVLRAIMWGVTGDRRRATRWASSAGQAFAWVLIATGLAMMLGLHVPVFGTGLVGGLWLAFIGWFLNRAALVSYQQLLVRQSLEDVPVSRLMQSHFSTVEPDASVDRFVDEHVMGTDQRAFPVLDHGRFVGLVCLRDVRKVSREAWPHTAVRQIMTPADAIAALGPREDASEALMTLTRRDINQLPVVESGRVVGLLRREDVLRWLSLYGDTTLVKGDAGGGGPR